MGGIDLAVEDGLMPPLPLEEQQLAFGLIAPFLARQGDFGTEAPPADQGRATASERPLAGGGLDLGVGAAGQPGVVEAPVAVDLDLKRAQLGRRGAVGGGDLP